MKLLFPHVQSRDDISREDFEHYCLKPAMEMRAVIKKQLCIIDPKEFNVLGRIRFQRWCIRSVISGAACSVDES